MNEERILPEEQEDAIAKSLQLKVQEQTKNLNPKEWRDIMEDAKLINKKEKRNAKLVGIAAGVALVAMAVSGFLALQLGDSKGETKPVDKQKNVKIQTTTTTTATTTTTTTQPAKKVDALVHPELLGRLIQLKAIESTDKDGNARIVKFEVYDTTTKKLVRTISAPKDVVGLEIASTTNRAISFRTWSDDGPASKNFTYLIPEDKIVETGEATRAYSPDNTQYVEIPSWWNREVIDPSTVVLNDGTNLKVNLEIISAKWFNDNEILLGVRNKDLTVQYRVFDLSKPLTLNNSRLVTNLDNDDSVYDVIQPGSQKFILVFKMVQSNTSIDSIGPVKYAGSVRVVNIDTKKVLGSIDVGPFNSTSGTSFLLTSFQKDENNIIFNEGANALTKDFKTGMIIQPNTPSLFMAR